MHPGYAVDVLAEYSQGEHRVESSNTHLLLPFPSTRPQPCGNERLAQLLASAAWNTHPQVARPPPANPSLRGPHVSPHPQQSRPIPYHHQGDSTNQYHDDVPEGRDVHQTAVQTQQCEIAQSLLAQKLLP